ncbi:glycosyltransferase [Sutcliffiella horikoshii]|uniref:glycosyltransferase n=1 Tax=Sutcliffiella horikoshii TaxID=79883 RepID=UPI003CF8323B
MTKVWIKKLINLLQWVFDKLLTTNQRKFIKSRLTSKQKQYLKKKFSIGTTQKRLKKLETIKFKLRNLGLEERAYAELEREFLSSHDEQMRKLAGWELAVWHANHQTIEDAKKSLHFLSLLDIDKKDMEAVRRYAILSAESLQILGRTQDAKDIISKTLQITNHPDLLLAFANLMEEESSKLKWINKCLNSFELVPVHLNGNKGDTLYDHLCVGDSPGIYKGNLDKVTVIIPVYNAQEVIRTSLESILCQTWSNLEVIVVDDCSTDDTVNILQSYCEQDERVKLIQMDVNGGAYVARNQALKSASGDFITINDADDWSHPQKIEKQVLFLQQNKKVIGCTSQQARLTEDLQFFRRGKPGEYLFSNMSSFMFRKKPVIESIGFWDCVRFGADSEFIKRIKMIFGDKSVVEIPTGPLSFQRQTAGSLTGSSAFGFPGYFMGARREYQEAQSYHHSIANSLYYNFPIEQRPFAIPEPMLPGRQKRSERRHFDVIIISDFRLDGGSNMSNLEEIKAQKKLGLKTGLVQMARYDYPAKKKINRKIRNELDGNQVEILVYGEKVSCDVLIVRYPPILQEKQKYIPDIKAGKINVIINQTPMSDYGHSGVLRFDLIQCEANLHDYFGKKGTWYPIGPLVRQALLKHHSDQLTHINLSEENWYNIIHLNEWKRKKRARSISSVKIGRHSRGHEMKWPADRKHLLQVYPDSPEVEVHILGGAEVPKKILGTLPANWIVYEFGSVHPKDFLATLDVFVYFTHHDWVESFGRVIIEAMATGVPVIIPPSYKELFGEAAIYAEPSEVQDKIKKLTEDNVLYHYQVEKAWSYVERKFGYTMHAERISNKRESENLETVNPRN